MEHCRGTWQIQLARQKRNWEDSGSQNLLIKLMLPEQVAQKQSKGFQS